MNESTLRIPQADLDDLTTRLARTRWPGEIPGTGWDHGIPQDRVRALATRWAAFDWRAHEAELNALPQYVTEIGGDRVYFVHVRNADPHALPLVLTHGWPGSTVEFLDVIGKLAPHFHLVIPAIPGFGLSGPTTRPGWGMGRVARAWAELMDRLGYRRYGAQGGDWGSGISQALAAIAPEHVVGVHVNYLPMAGPADGLGDADRARLEKTMRLAANRHPHQILFAATPQTPAYALNDSPAGLLAFLGEKFHTWSDPSTPVPDDRVIANIAHHWFLGTAGSAARLVKESGLPTSRPPMTAPLGVAVLPCDITQSIRPLAEQRYDIHHWTEFERGGHFAALEVPDAFATDVTTFFRTLTNR
ncbi:epoxide hydrolase family protein [Actinoplanes sp. NPDC051861]|uniref:epoxide hydrolase family protein n=1 Tax=Actinoplanes sp. NPDC051861 TaxID=3155170 RepID=UPI0034257CE3